MNLGDLEYINLLKEKLEQQQARLVILSDVRMSFRIEVKNARGKYTVMSRPHAESDKERNSLTSTSIDLVSASLKQEVTARINYYTRELAKFGIEAA